MKNFMNEEPNMSELKVSHVRLEKDTVKNKHIWYVHYYNSTEVTIFEEGNTILVIFEKPYIATVYYSKLHSIPAGNEKEITFRYLDFKYRVPIACHSSFVSKVKPIYPVTSEDSISYKKLYE